MVPAGRHGPGPVLKRIFLQLVMRTGPQYVEGGRRPIVPIDQWSPRNPHRSVQCH